ncbi:hypothetical protein CEXT_172981 [Caerostris extrusa]|uniref:Uncharacterized protein n=1 Tax=Caerostris extrusa TaxID=172846 RepID=A0AAV4P6D8_CAEEX|nr:hypothetical protein CEXT_172981 [Caerostris extrusa]
MLIGSCSRNVTQFLWWMDIISSGSSSSFMIAPACVTFRCHLVGFAQLLTHHLVIWSVIKRLCHIQYSRMSRLAKAKDMSHVYYANARF